MTYKTTTIFELNHLKIIKAIFSFPEFVSDKKISSYT